MEAIDINDLMVGNWVFADGIPQQVKSIIKVNKGEKNNGFTNDYIIFYGALTSIIKDDYDEPYITGIQLTEEIILNCEGVEKYLNYDELFIYHNYLIEYNFIAEKWHIRLKVNLDDSVFITEIDYLHQLQNLFNITKQHLQIKW